MKIISLTSVFYSKDLFELVCKKSYAQISLPHVTVDLLNQFYQQSQS